jgi:hypothetical protein
MVYFQVLSGKLPEEPEENEDLEEPEENEDLCNFRC